MRDWVGAAAQRTTSTERQSIELSVSKDVLQEVSGIEVPTSPLGCPTTLAYPKQAFLTFELLTRKLHTSLKVSHDDQDVQWGLSASIPAIIKSSETM